MLKNTIIGLLCVGMVVLFAMELRTKQQLSQTVDVMADVAHKTTQLEETQHQLIGIMKDMVRMIKR